MRLYIHPASCSLADHIALIEAGLSYELVSIDREKRTSDGRDYLTVNPRGFVPALELEDGTVLTENLAILAYIADRSGRLLPEGHLGRSRALEALSYMATTIHGGLAPFFRNASGPEKDKGSAAVANALTFLDRQLGHDPFLLGQTMSIADPYLFWALLWSSRFGIPAPERLGAFFERMSREASVVRALDEEGVSLE